MWNLFRYLVYLIKCKWKLRITLPTVNSLNIITICTQFLYYFARSVHLLVNSFDTHVETAVEM
jgi:hypothetical protein